MISRISDLQLSLFVPFNFSAVLQLKHHFLFAVNRHGINRRIPQPLVKLSDEVAGFQRLEERLYPVCLELASEDALIGVGALRFKYLILFSKRCVLCFVILLADFGVGVFINAFPKQFGSNITLCFKRLQL